MSSYHERPDDWGPLDWCVPVKNGKGLIKHGHTDPEDHSRCGPVLFCCVRSARLFRDMYPNSEEASARFRMLGASVISGWMAAGITTVFFIFCDPASSTGLLSIGLSDEAARDAVMKAQPLEDWADEAQSLEDAEAGSGEDQFLLNLVRQRSQKQADEDG